MTRHKYLAAALLIGSTVPAAAATSPLQIASSVSVERRSVAQDGTVRVALVPAKRATPGDRVVFVLDYRNTGKAPLADVVFDNPVPAGIAFRAAAGLPEPLLSTDGKTYAALAALRVAGRPATPADVTHVRWKLVAPIAPGAAGRLAFAAVLK